MAQAKGKEYRGYCSSTKYLRGEQVKERDDISRYRGRKPVAVDFEEEE